MNIQTAIACRKQDLPVVGALISSREAIPPTMPVNDVAERFFSYRDLDSLALVDDGRVFGLATRAKSFAILFRRFGFELFGKDPIIEIADKNPLVVQEGESLDATLESAMARSHQDIYDEVVVVDRAGTFKGLLSVKEMVLAQSRALAGCITERDAARAGLAEMKSVHETRLGRLTHVARDAGQQVSSASGIIRLLVTALKKGEYQWASEELSLLSNDVDSLQDTMATLLELSWAEPEAVRKGVKSLSSVRLSSHEFPPR